MNDPSPLMMSRSYGLWPPQAPAGEESSNPFPNPNRPPFVATGAPNYARPHWKPNNKGKKPPSGPDSAPGVAGPSYMPPVDHSDAPQQHYQTRCGRPPRRFYKKKHNNNNHNRAAPFAPRNTTSFLIRAKRAGGIASLVSPCPVTPAVLPTPQFSPTREALVDSAKEEWGVDGYGSMNGLIRLRSPRTPAAVPPSIAADEDAADEVSSDSDVEEHVEVERRLDHDLRRFEMLYCPGFTDPEDRRDGSTHPHAPAHTHAHTLGPSFLLGSHVDDQDAQILRLEEENLSLRDRLFLMERDMEDMRRRLVMIEMECRRCSSARDDGNSHNNNNNNDTASAVDEMSDTDEAGGVCSEKSVGD